MKKRRASSFHFFAVVVFVFALLLAWGTLPALAQPPDTMMIVGNWEGTLDPGAQSKKKIVVHIAAAQDGSLTGSIDYPDQDTSGIPITAITYKAPVLHFESSSIPGFYDGTMDKQNSLITGTWKQGITPLSLVLKRTP
jgi:hypothetical protein